MTEKLRLIAEVLKPQGIKGSIKCRVLTDDAKLFCKLKTVIIEGVTYAVISASGDKDCAFLTLQGLSDRNSAELLRNKGVYTTEEQAQLLKVGEYFIDRLIGCTVMSEQEVYGKLIDIFQFSPAADVFQLQNEKGNRINFPNVKGIIIKVDFDKAVIYVDKERFYEVAVFED